MTLVSDGSNQVEGAGNAVATWQHPAWIDPMTNSSFASAIWIWSSFYVENPNIDETKTFIKNFNWAGPINSASLNVATDNSNEIYINGNLLAANPQENNFSTGNSDSYDVKTLIQNGNNVLKIKVKNWGLVGAGPTGNPAGLLYRMDLSSAAKKCNQPSTTDNDD